MSVLKLSRSSVTQNLNLPEDSRELNFHLNLGSTLYWYTTVTGKKILGVDDYR